MNDSTGPASEVSDQSIRLCDNRMLQLACESGDLRTAIMTANSFELTAADARVDENDALLSACKNGHLEVAKWLVERFGLTPDDAREKSHYALEWACANGHLAVARWLLDWTKPGPAELAKILSSIESPGPGVVALLTE